MARRVRHFLSPGPLLKRRTASLPDMSNVPPSKGVFAVPLVDLLAHEGTTIPAVVKKVVEHLEQEALLEEGIYRVNGNAKVIANLRSSFDKCGDADFQDQEVASVAGLLKLFLRELPEPLIPNELLKEFVGLQQAHPGAATPVALDLLKQALKRLPDANLRVLFYIIKHLTRVAQHSDTNKMTAVSLSIVIGPNIFRCGSGIEGLRLQGYTNSVMCRMIQYHQDLFTDDMQLTSPEEEVPNCQEKKIPSKPQPYADYTKEKLRVSSPDSPVKSSYPPDKTGAEGSGSYLEMSIDEAIERTSGTQSPCSPAKAHSKDLLQGIHSPKGNFAGDYEAQPVLRSSSFPETLHVSGDVSERKELDSQEFRRQYAKRGKKFYRGSHQEWIGSQGEDGGGSGIDHVDGEVQQIPVVPKLLATAGKHHSLARHSSSFEEDVYPLRTPSPFSWRSSPGTSPPASPALTPRSSRIGSVIKDRVKQFLLMPPQSELLEIHQHNSQEKQELHRTVAAAHVYGLLLPERMYWLCTKSRAMDVTCSLHLRANDHLVASSTDELSLRENNRAVTDMVHSSPQATEGYVKLRNQSGAEGHSRSRKLRNRRSALHGDTGVASTGPSGDLLSDMDVQIVSVDSERKERAGSKGRQSRRGKVADLVSQFDTDCDGKDSGAESCHLQRSLHGFSEPLATVGHNIGSANTQDDEQSRRRLSAASSDNVFESPKHSQSDRVEFDAIISSGTLQHLTLGRPKVPSRQKPSRYNVVLPLSSMKKETTLSGHSSSDQEVADFTSLDTESGLVSVQKGWTESFDDGCSLRTSDSSEKNKPPRGVSLEGGTCLVQDRDHPLIDVLTKIMSSLRERRLKTGIPEELEFMTSEQVLCEKQLIQKALLQYEKHYGRPISKDDKEIMRPLYDRYRMVKKRRASQTLSLMATTETDREMDALGLTSESLPSVTLLKSELTQSLPVHSSRYTEDIAVTLSKSAHEDTTSCLNRTLDTRFSDPSIYHFKHHLLSERELGNAHVEDLRAQQVATHEIKKELRKVLKEYEKGFMALHGRLVARDDRKPMQQEYRNYRDIKARLKLIEVLLTKKTTQRTV